MVIQAKLNYNAPFISTGGSEFSFINNDGGIINQQALFHHQPNHSQSFLDVHMAKQRQEIDQFIRLQSERLRYVLREQRRQETETILMKMETKALVLMAQKEEEMSRALRTKRWSQRLTRRLNRLEREQPIRHHFGMPRPLGHTSKNPLLRDTSSSFTS